MLRWCRPPARSGTSRTCVRTTAPRTPVISLHASTIRLDFAPSRFSPVLSPRSSGLQGWTARSWEPLDWETLDPVFCAFPAVGVFDGHPLGGDWRGRPAIVVRTCRVHGSLASAADDQQHGCRWLPPCMSPCFSPRHAADTREQRKECSSPPVRPRVPKKKQGGKDLKEITWPGRGSKSVEGRAREQISIRGILWKSIWNCTCFEGERRETPHPTDPPNLLCICHCSFFLILHCTSTSTTTIAGYTHFTPRTENNERHATAVACLLLVDHHWVLLRSGCGLLPS